MLVWQIDGELQPVEWEDALVATAKTLRAAGEKTAVVAGGLSDAEVTRHASHETRVRTIVKPPRQVFPADMTDIQLNWEYKGWFNAYFTSGCFSMVYILRLCVLLFTSSITSDGSEGRGSGEASVWCQCLMVLYSLPAVSDGGEGSGEALCVSV